MLGLLDSAELSGFSSRLASFILKYLSTFMAIFLASSLLGAPLFGSIIKFAFDQGYLINKSFAWIGI